MQQQVEALGLQDFNPADQNLDAAINDAAKNVTARIEETLADNGIAFEFDAGIEEFDDHIAYNAARATYALDLLDANELKITPAKQDKPSRSLGETSKKVLSGALAVFIGVGAVSPSVAATPPAAKGAGGNNPELTPKAPSFSPYSLHQIGEAREGKKQNADDIRLTEKSFLKQNKIFAKRMAVDGADKSSKGWVFRAFGHPDPSKDTKHAGEHLANIVDSPDFVDGELTSDAKDVINSNAKETGGIHNQFGATLEKGRHVGGLRVTEMHTDKHGRVVAHVKVGNNEAVKLPNNTVLAMVDTADADKNPDTLLAVSNDLGYNTDADASAEMGRFSWVKKEYKKIKCDCGCGGMHTQPGSVSISTPNVASTPNVTTTVSVPSQPGVQPHHNGHGHINTTHPNHPHGHGHHHHGHNGQSQTQTQTQSQEQSQTQTQSQSQEQSQTQTPLPQEEQPIKTAQPLPGPAVPNTGDVLTQTGGQDAPSQSGESPADVPRPSQPQAPAPQSPSSETQGRPPAHQGQDGGPAQPSTPVPSTSESTGHGGPVDPDVVK